MTSFCKYDVVVVKFPFASSLKYKARPAVIVSTNDFNRNSRETLLILAISSQISSKLVMERSIENWEAAGLLKPSLFKNSIATITQASVLHRLGSLSQKDIAQLNRQLEKVCS